VHGNKDVVVAPINAFILAQHLPNAQLVMYPDASHGAQSQHAGVFLKHARMFLNE
jgi:pimeloyl-ACP methyl ester carboxylesterase